MSLRIIGGNLSGRKLAMPPRDTTRPMMDRVRAAVFNILLHHDFGDGVGRTLDGTRVLDAFCGSGALGFEAISRGCAHATFFDKDRTALNIAKENAETMKIMEACAFIQSDATKPPRADAPCQLIFTAPPYHHDLIPPTLLALQNNNWMAQDTIIVAETAKKEPLPLPNNFELLFERSYANVRVSFLKLA